MNALLHDVEEKSDGDGEDEEEWGGIEDEEAEEEAPELVDHEEEYIDEDKYTTVTVEGIEISKNGITRTADEEDSDDGIHEEKGKVIKEEKVKKVWPKKPRKKKFTYETKAERKMTRQKQKSGSRAAAGARRGNN